MSAERQPENAEPQEAAAPSRLRALPGGARRRSSPVSVARSADDVRAIARVLGHDDIVVMPSRTGSKWVPTCACGWVGAGMVRQVEALSKARHHIARAVSDAQRWADSHGVPLGRALGELAVDQHDLQLVVEARIEARHAAASD